MKKRYIFFIIYLAVMFALIAVALILNPIDRLTYTGYVLKAPTRAGNVMLVIGGIMTGIFLIYLIGWRIVKYILVKLGKSPDDYFIIKVDAEKSVDHWLLTTNGIYKKKNDKAELERDRRDNKTVEW